MRFERILWLMPIAYAVHIVEEYLAGFPAWVRTVLGGGMEAGDFLFNNALFMAVLISLSLWASRSASGLAAFLLMAWASGNLFWNFVFHLATTAAFDRYSPGLVTAALFYPPLLFLSGAAAVRGGRLTPAGAAGAFALGAGLMLFVIWAWL